MSTKCATEVSPYFSANGLVTVSNANHLNIVHHRNRWGRALNNQLLVIHRFSGHNASIKSNNLNHSPNLPPYIRSQQLCVDKHCRAWCIHILQSNNPIELKSGLGTRFALELTLRSEKPNGINSSLLYREGEGGWVPQGIWDLSATSCPEKH